MKAHTCSTSAPKAFEFAALAAAMMELVLLNAAASAPPRAAVCSLVVVDTCSFSEAFPVDTCSFTATTADAISCRACPRTHCCFWTDL